MPTVEISFYFQLKDFIYLWNCEEVQIKKREKWIIKRLIKQIKQSWFAIYMIHFPVYLLALFVFKDMELYYVIMLMCTNGPWLLQFELHLGLKWTGSIEVHTEHRPMKWQTNGHDRGYNFGPFLILGFKVLLKEELKYLSFEIWKRLNERNK